MSDGIIAALISAHALIAASSGTILVTKRKEREAVWRDKRLEYYEEFFAAASGIVGQGTPAPAQVRFANAVNNLHLVGSASVIRSLHAFTDVIAESNKQSFSQDQHDDLWSRLIWDIRRDIGTEPTKSPSHFRARLWASGTGSNVKRPYSLNTFSEWEDALDSEAFDRL